MNPFDLVKVDFAGTIVHARPIEFVYDEKSEPIKATKLVTTCPKCGSFNEIDATLIVIVEDVTITAHCGQCGQKPEATLETQEKPIAVPIAKPALMPVVPAVLIRQEAIKSKASVDVDDNGFVSNGVFVDPIELGIFQIEEL